MDPTTTMMNLNFWGFRTPCVLVFLMRVPSTILSFCCKFTSQCKRSMFFPLSLSCSSSLNNVHLFSLYKLKILKLPTLALFFISIFTGEDEETLNEWSMDHVNFFLWLDLLYAKLRWWLLGSISTVDRIFIWVRRILYYNNR